MRDVAEELSKHVVDMGQRASDDFFELHVASSRLRDTGVDMDPGHLTALPLGRTDNPMKFSSTMRQSNLTEQGAHV